MSLYFRIRWFVLHKISSAMYFLESEGLFKIQYTVDMWLDAGAKFRANVSVQTPVIDLSPWDLGIFFRSCFHLSVSS